MEVRFYETVDDALLRFAVIISKTDDKWVFCKHRERDTYEIPGGHRENGESIIDTAKRELYEETGATQFTLMPVCGYKVEDYGMLYYAQIEKMEKQLSHEIRSIRLCKKIPEELTYPRIHPYLLIEAKRRNFIRF